MEIEGRIIMDIPQVEGVSKAGNPWKKKEWVLETFGQYPRKVKFDTFGDRVDSIRFELGKDYVVSVDAESREFNGRWYTDLRCYAAREMQAAPGGMQGGGNMMNQPMQAPQQPAFVQPQAPQPSFGQSGSDDLPF